MGGKIWNSLLGVSIALCDANEGDGGFCVLPGSHKINYPLPDDIRHGNSDAFHQHVRQVPTKAGDVIIFSEATVHGAMAWKAERQRRLALYRFAPANMAYGRAYTEDWGIPHIQDLCTPEELAILTPPFAPRLERPGTAEKRGKLKKDHDKQIFGTAYF